VIQENYENIKEWFNNHSISFSGDDAHVQMNIDLKREHSLKTSEIIKDLGQSENLIESDLLLAECIALLHDVGRFTQLAQYGTFSDSKEVNHANMGVTILEEEQILKHLDEEEQNIILKAIGMHNMAKLPKIQDKNLLFFTEILRDADKLDIYRIVSEHYCSKKINPNKMLELDLPEKPDISKKVYNCIIGEKVVNIENVMTLNDFKLMHMSWVYDMHLKRSYQIVNEKSYLKKIFDTLPKTDEVIDMYRNMKIYMENKL